MKNIPEIFQKAREMVSEARELALKRYQGSFHIDWKADRSPVTESDREIEQFLRGALREAFPEHGILGEEDGQERCDAEYSWIIDPIDGTRSFARGIPIFGIQLALTRGPEVLIGILDYPALNENLAAARGQGCFWQNKVCRVAAPTHWEEMMIYLHEPEWVRQHHPQLFAQLHRAQKLRNWGDGYSFALAISGRVELALDPRLDIWDAAPLPVLIEEAGGAFANWQGQRDFRAGSAILGHPASVAGVLEFLA